MDPDQLKTHVQALDTSTTIAPKDMAVVQRYVPNPLLINGRKHDLRVYALITSCDPLVVYMYRRRGMVKFSSQKHSYDTTCTWAHCSNNSLNVTNPDYEKIAQEGVRTYIDVCIDT